MNWDAKPWPHRSDDRMTHYHGYIATPAGWLREEEILGNEEEDS